MNFDNILKNNLPIQDCEKEYRDALDKINYKIVVLDDDPTGTQTVNSVNVYTDWSYESILSGFEEPDKMFFILTNSRSFTKEKTAIVHKEISLNILKASVATNKNFIIISRSDSTLRGHFPLETEVLKNTIEENSENKFDGEIIIPFFYEGGRLTVNDIHYVKENDILIPAAETEFANDSAFSYKSSNLNDWISEKTDGEYKNSISISLEDIRTKNIFLIRDKLNSVNNFNKVIVNALDNNDLKIFVVALAQALENKNFIFRTAAGFLGAITGIEGKYPDIKDLTPKTENGGLIIVGSYTEKTTRQLDKLKDLDVKFIEFNHNLIFNNGDINQEVNRVVYEAEAFLKSKNNVAIYTSREKLDLYDKEKALQASVLISSYVSEIVRKINTEIKFIIAKGGITSSDVATLGLNIKKAYILGQIEAGIPVWLTGPEAKLPNMPYIIFPGNVGDDYTLKKVVLYLN